MAAFTSSVEASPSSTIASAVASSVDSESVFASPIASARWTSLRLGSGMPASRK